VKGAFVLTADTHDDTDQQAFMDEVSSWLSDLGYEVEIRGLVVSKDFAEWEEKLRNHS